MCWVDVGIVVAVQEHKAGHSNHCAAHQRGCTRLSECGGQVCCWRTAATHWGAKVCAAAAAAATAAAAAAAAHTVMHSPIAAAATAVAVLPSRRCARVCRKGRKRAAPDKHTGASAAAPKRTASASQRAAAERAAQPRVEPTAPDAMRSPPPGSVAAEESAVAEVLGILLEDGSARARASRSFFLVVASSQTHEPSLCAPSAGNVGDEQMNCSIDISLQASQERRRSRKLRRMMFEESPPVHADAVRLSPAQRLRARAHTHARRVVMQTTAAAGTGINSRRLRQQTRIVQSIAAAVSAARRISPARHGITTRAHRRSCPARK